MILLSFVTIVFSDYIRNNIIEVTVDNVNAAIDTFLAILNASLIAFENLANKSSPKTFMLSTVISNRIIHICNFFV